MSVWCVIVGGYHYGNKGEKKIQEKGGNNAGSTKNNNSNVQEAEDSKDEKNSEMQD